jgi:hypothetical protein
LALADRDVGDHQFDFVNRFAIGRVDAQGDIVPGSIETFDTLRAANDAALARKGFDLINGSTPLGGNRSTIYAGATTSGLFRVEVSGGAFRSLAFTNISHARFVILHEFQHGLGVSSEALANTNALRTMGLLK